MPNTQFAGCYAQQKKDIDKKMERLTNKEFQNSLDITNDELEKYIPQLLKGLWELGSMPEYILELIDRNITTKFTNVIDLGCGKGAVLVKLAKRFDIKGIGVDILPDFIEEANHYANKYAVSDRVEFKTEDIVDTIKATSNQDIVIYGYDSEVLGDLNNTLIELTKCIKADGYVLLEYMFVEKPREGVTTDREMRNIIEQAGYSVLDRIDWNRETLKQTNKQITEIIKENVKRLIAQYPDQEDVFSGYLQNQIEECEELENDYFCTTLLLRQKNYCA